MGISYSQDQVYHSTNDSAGIAQNTDICSEWFKLRIDSANPAGIPGGEALVFLGTVIFKFWNTFLPTATTTINARFHISVFPNVSQIDVPLTKGSTYTIALSHYGKPDAPAQNLWLNGVKNHFASNSGYTTDRTDPLSIGLTLSTPNVDFTIEDYTIWNGYQLTTADVLNMTNGASPTGIGLSASKIYYWSLRGSPGIVPQIGDSGLKNTASSGPDFISINGTGIALYSSPLIWSPAVTAHPYVTTCGKNVAITFTANVDNSTQIPTQVITDPTITVNGTGFGSLVNQAFALGTNQCLLYSTPSGVQVSPGDTVSLFSPISWANTAAGSIGSISGIIDNRSGRSSVGADTVTKTLRMGINNSHTDALEYFPFKNAAHLAGAPGTFGPVPFGNWQITSTARETGLWLLVWDATTPLTPVIFDLNTSDPSRVQITSVSAYDVSPTSGSGYVRVFDVEPVPSSNWDTTYGGFSVNLHNVYNQNHANLWIYLPGEWSFVSGVPSFDRSNSYALSDVYKDRVQNVGSMRAVDSTACGGACQSYPYPELLPPANAEFFWTNARYGPVQSFTSIGPVNTGITPWTYNSLYRQSGETFSATLVDPINTAPAVSTNETYRFSDAATAPLIAGLDIQKDSEVMRILSVAGSSVTLYRGSNGTTPATHATGVVTVFGRRPITDFVNGNGLRGGTCTYIITTNVPHGMTSLQFYQWNNGPIDFTAKDGTVFTNHGGSQNFDLGGTVCVTGPNTFLSFSGTSTDPNGTTPSGTWSLTGVTKQDVRYTGMPIESYCQMARQFPFVNIHINIPVDAVDDMVYTYARIVRDNFPAGRKIYVEYANEPWNFAYPFRAYAYVTIMAGIAMPQNLNTYLMAYYAYRSSQVHQIFRNVFTAAGRGNEIMGIVNCQMGSSSTQVTPNLNIGLTLGTPFDAVACAPYYDITVNSTTLAAYSVYDDDQMCDLATLDMKHDLTNISASIADNLNAMNAYNIANGKNCILIGYEGGLSYVSLHGAPYSDERDNDIQYNPYIYFTEQAYYKLLQDFGFKNLHLYALGIGFEPNCWGLYHARREPHSLGRGIGNETNNKHALVNPTSPYYLGGDWRTASTKQDILLDSVRGQALIDWNSQIGSITPSYRNAYHILIKAGKSFLKIFSGNA